MVERHAIFSKFSQNYLFEELQAVKQAFIKKYPHKKLIDLSIGDTSQPLSSNVINTLKKNSVRQGQKDFYTGYGPVSGNPELRELIAQTLYKHTSVTKKDIFISDGAKPALDRLHRLFGPRVSVALPDPAYPAYLDVCIANGVSSITFLPGKEEHNFFPDPKAIPRTDIIHICSPNNPTGTVASKEYLKTLVDIALTNQSVIIFDAVYSSFVTCSDLPRSIFEIPNAHKCAIEVNSLSKSAGFSGLRLGWVVISDDLLYHDGKSIKADWIRINSSIFNGASSLIQTAAQATVINTRVEVYQKNARLLKEVFVNRNFVAYGGTHSPYVWIKIPKMTSREAFSYFLNEFNILTSPGSGFGSHGEGYLRFSGLARSEDIMSAIERLSCLII